MKSEMSWGGAGPVTSRSYTCGHCGNAQASHEGWTAKNPGQGHHAAFIYICHFCRRPTFFDEQGKQSPGSVAGISVTGIDDRSVDAIYQEARSALSAGCYSAAVMCCRKLLMHIAVSKGAKPGLSFAAYVEYLRESGYVPPDAKAWVDHIRAKGNEANHEIAIAKQEDANELLEFSAVLLKVIYEFPSAMRKRYTPLADIKPA
jgi:hypothetical protein